MNTQFISFHSSSPQNGDNGSSECYHITFGILWWFEQHKKQVESKIFLDGTIYEFAHST